MTAHLSDEALWAVGLGARLRMLQASFADDDAAARRDYIAEELEREIREIPASRRKAYLEALAERFPGWESATVPADEVVPEAAPIVDSSPESLVMQLTALAGTLSDADRRELADRLQEAGFALTVTLSAAAQETDDIPAELQKKLSLDPNQALDRKRAMRLVAVLIDLVVTMDQVAWNVWKNLAPNSRVRRDPGPTGDLRKVAGPFLVGDPEVSTAQVTQLLDKTRQLIAGLLAAVGATGEAFARQYLTRFSPQSIKEAADAEPGFFIGPEQRCWRKYTQLFNDVSGVTIENEIANAIVKYTEDLILGGGRPPSDGPGGS
jgi:hypothetical protein